MYDARKKGKGEEEKRERGGRERERERERERKLHEPDVRERKSISSVLFSISKDISIESHFVAR